MRPGGWYVTPFLQSDQSLEELIQADARRVRDAGASAEALGAELVTLLEAGRDSDWAIPSSQRGFQVEIRRRRGVMTCPWAPDEQARCEKGDGGRRAGANQFLVRNVETGAVVEGFAFTAHLIAEHDFFGGPGTPFRIEPDDLVAFFGGPAGESA